jgi:molybdate transport system substrate-binding protein
MRRFVALGLFLVLGVTGAGAQQSPPTFRVFAAGSLNGAFTTLLARFGSGAATFGPSGALRQRIEAGEAADMLASADMTQPEALAKNDEFTPVVLFARNRMCALARASLGLNQRNMLRKMLDPSVRLATSTPKSDPSGDYAWAMFEKAEVMQPGARAILVAKALQLMGAPGQKPPVPGKGPVEGIFLADEADMMLSYCSGLATVQEAVPDLVVVPAPPELEPHPAFGMTVRKSNAAALRFALFVLSPASQAVLGEAGFIPVAAP